MHANQIDLNAIHNAFATAVLSWNQQGQDVVNGVAAIEFHDPGDLAFGRGRSAGRKGFEIQKSALPFVPANDDIVQMDGNLWRVIELINYREANAWRVFVEEAGQ